MPTQNNEVIEGEVIETNEEKKPDQQIVKREEDQIVPDAKNMFMLAEGLYRSELFPGVKNKYGALTIIEYGRELGLKPVISLQTMSFVKGHICIESKAMLALAKQKGIRIKVIEKNKDKSLLEFSKKGEDPYVETFAIEDAKRAGLLHKDNWQAYPEEMCFWRCVAKGLRVYDPESILGLYTVDEMRDAEKPFGEAKAYDDKKKKTIKVDDMKKEEKPEPKKETKSKTTTKKKAAGKKKQEEKKPEPEPESKPEDRPSKQQPEEKLEMYAEALVEGFKIRYGVDKHEKEYREFKRFLGEFFGEEKKKTFVKKNQWGHWSIKEGKVEDVALLVEHFNWVTAQYDEWKKNQPKEGEIPF